MRRTADPDYLAVWWQSRPEAAEGIARLGWLGDPTAVVGVEERGGSGGEGGATFEVPVYGASPEFASFARERRLELAERECGFGCADYWLLSDGRIVAQWSERLGSFDRFMSTATDIIGPMIITGGLATAFGAAAAASGIPGSIAPIVGRAAGQAAFAAGTGRDIDAGALLTRAAVSYFAPGAEVAQEGTSVDDWVSFEELEGGTSWGDVSDWEGMADIEPGPGFTMPFEPGDGGYGDFATLPGGADFEPAEGSPWGTWETENRGWVPAPAVPDVSMEPTTPSTPPPVAAPQVPAASSRDFDFDKVVKQVTGAAISAISVVRAWETRKQPINPVARSTDPQGRTTVAKSDGNIYTRSPSGQVTASRPPVGAPQSTLDGFVIVNNGDGTFTRVDPAGGSQTVRYGAMPAPAAGGVLPTRGGFEPTTLLIAGGLAIGAFMLARR